MITMRASGRWAAMCGVDIEMSAVLIFVAVFNLPTGWCLYRLFQVERELGRHLTGTGWFSIAMFSSTILRGSFRPEAEPLLRARRRWIKLTFVAFTFGCGATFAAHRLVLGGA